MVDIATERTSLNMARNRAVAWDKTPATERQVQSILFFLSKTNKSASDIGLSPMDNQASLSKWKANNIIASLAEEAICGKGAGA